MLLDSHIVLFTQLVIAELFLGRRFAWCEITLITVTRLLVYMTVQYQFSGDWLRPACKHSETGNAKMPLIKPQPWPEPDTWIVFSHLRDIGGSRCLQWVVSCMVGYLRECICSGLCSVQGRLMLCPVLEQCVLVLKSYLHGDVYWLIQKVLIWSIFYSFLRFTVKLIE